MKRRFYTEVFNDGRHVTVIVTGTGVEIEATYVDPIEGGINAVERIELSRDELAFVMEKVLRS